MKRLVIKNGMLIDQMNDLHSVKKDILIEDGYITEIAENISCNDAKIINAEGQYVSAGMIDVHMHNHLGNKDLQLDDPDELGVMRGVTTMIECGSVWIDMLDEFAEESDRTKTRYLCLLSGHGEDGFGKNGSQNIDKIIPEHYQEAKNKYPELIVGLKVACSNTITNDKGYMLVKHAKKIAELLNVPLTIHVGNFPPDPCGLVEFLDKGDVVTHTYHQKEISLFMADGAPKESFVRARQRGVLFDVGHGSASYSFMTFDKARRKGFLPDIISTDIRKVNINGPVYSLALVMSKFLKYMSLEDVIKAVTYTPAKTYKLEKLGELRVGYKADITTFMIEDVDMEAEDCNYNHQHLDKLIVPKLAIVSKGGNSELYSVDERFIGRR